MKRLLMAALAGLLLAVGAAGQKIPRATPAGKEALDELVGACLEDGGLKAVKVAGGRRLEVTDEDKLRATVAAHAELLKPALRDALVASFHQGEEAGWPAQIALLRAYGREKEDELALGFAAFFTGWAAEQQQSAVAVRSYREAERYFDAAGETGWQALSLNNLGEVYRALGEYRKALECHQKALALRQQLYPGPHPDVALSLSYLGVVSHALGEYAQALEYHQKALALFQQLYPGPHPSVAASLNNLGEVYRALGEYAQALELHL
jgi:tetratricopeptide (TPR) repeat protein